MKQAEALIAALRRERDLACDLKAAVSSLSDEDQDEEQKVDKPAKR
jgi:hypothetical protein